MPSRRLGAALDAFESPDASALVRLATSGPFNIRQFLAATQASPYTARQVLDRLERLRIVKTTYTNQGAIQVGSVDLTPAGRKIAQKLLELEDLVADVIEPELGADARRVED